MHKLGKRLSRLLFAIFIVYSVYSLVHGFIASKKVLDRHNQTEKDYTLALDRNKALRTQLEIVNTDTYIELTARDRLGLVKPGEVAYKIVEED